jgi:chromosome partitioning protein
MKTKSNDAKVLSLLNQKGGVGKTTCAFNLAHALTMMKKKVLCIDMDPQANLSLLFSNSNDEGLADQNIFDENIFHLLVNSVRQLRSLHTPISLADVLQTKELSNDLEVDYLPAGMALSGFELSVAAINFPRQLILKNFIEKNDLRTIYDYIIIDGPPTLGLLVVNILCASDGVLVPFQLDQFSHKGLENFYTVIEEIEEMGITQAPKIIGHIPNLVEARRKLSGEHFNNIKSQYKQTKMFDQVNNKVHFLKAQKQKKSVFEYSSKDFLALQDNFKKMAKYVHKNLN